MSEQRPLPESELSALADRVAALEQDRTSQQLPRPLSPLGWSFRAAAVLTFVAVLLVEWMYPPWILYQPLEIYGTDIPKQSRDSGASPYGTVQGPYALVAKLGHHSHAAFGGHKESGGRFRAGIRHLEARGRGDTRSDVLKDANIDTQVFIGIDWERLLLECCLAVAPCTVLWALSYSPLGRWRALLWI